MRHATATILVSLFFALTAALPQTISQASRCAPTGCSSQICASQSVVTNCLYRPEYACYKSATCTSTSTGGCGWVQTPALKQCLAEYQPKTTTTSVPSATATPKPSSCRRGGCSGQLCYDPALGSGISTCEWRPQYACYRDATCSRNADGKCGWEQTEALKVCLSSSGSGISII